MTRPTETSRRQSIIEATIRAIHNKGTSAVTIREIAAAAGVSLGLAHHYFSSKDALMAATMVSVMRDYSRQVVRMLMRTRTPRERVSAIIAASLAREQFRPELVSAWLAFYASAQGTPDHAALLKIYARRLHSNLVHALSREIGAERAGIAANGIAALIDGLYVREGLGMVPAGANLDAVALVEDYVDAQVALARATASDSAKR